MASLDSLRAIHATLQGADVAVDAVSHGMTWSIYFHDPEGNRLEVFVDTPWRVSQPCRFAIDLALDDAQLYAFTAQRIQDLSG